MSLLDEAKSETRITGKERLVITWARENHIDVADLEALAADQTIGTATVARVLKRHGFPGSESAVKSWRRDVTAR